MVRIREAAELASVSKAESLVPWYVNLSRIKLRRLSQFVTLPPRPRVLEIGAGCGAGVVGWLRNGCDCIGLEPFEAARQNAQSLGQRLGLSLSMVAGVGENMPFEPNTFDLVNAQSVLEHVDDIDRVIFEAYRVLKPGGVFMFNCASAMCPRQEEIDGFPLFGWYPKKLKRRIMKWAQVHKPHLIGYTQRPAIHWVTTWSVRRMLRYHGFQHAWDRWDLRRLDEGGSIYRLTLRIVRSSWVTKLLADILIPDCGWAAQK